MMNLPAQINYWTHTDRYKNYDKTRKALFKVDQPAMRETKFAFKIHGLTEHLY